MTTPSLAIDSAARKEITALYRHFGAGLISGGELESRMPYTKERGLLEIDTLGILPYYGDLTDLKLAGEYRLPPEGREWICRIMLFLRSDLPYQWPSRLGFGFFVPLLSALTFGWFERWLHRGLPPGDNSVWPFYTRSEYEEALRNPPYLRGHQVI